MSEALPPVRPSARLKVATALLLIMMVMLPALTIEVGSRDLFRVATFLNTLLVLVMLPVATDQVHEWAQLPITWAFGTTFIVLFLVWQIVKGPVWDVDRTWLYLTLPLFLAAMVSWFRSIGDHGLLLLYRARMPMVAIAIGWICLRTAMSHHGLADPWPIGPAPMFRHIRSLNDELPWVIGLGLAFWPLVKTPERIVYGIAFFFFGYYTVWSGSRGQWLALVFLIIALAAARALPWRSKAAMVPLLLMLAGGLLVIVFGEGELFFQALGRSSHGTVTILTSGRTLIWQESLSRLFSSPSNFLFGFGPDAYFRLDVGRSFASYTGPTLQPHNSLLLWWLEFGTVGLATMIVLLAKALVLAMQHLRAGGGLQPRMVVAGLFIAQCGFSMVTGIAYHVMPLTFMLILLAYLIATPVPEPNSATVV